MKNITILLTLIISTSLIIGNSHIPANQEKYNFVSIDYIVKKYPEVTYQKCHEAQSFHYDKISFFPESNQQPYTGKFAPTFVITIPQGNYYSHENVYGDEGYIVVDDHYIIRDLLTYTENFALTVELFFGKSFQGVRKVPGRVVVLSKAWSRVYGHWMNEVLGRLAMVELLGIEYDWILIPPTENRKFMLETLDLWGISRDKIIESKGEFCCIQADELIVPSIPGRRQALSGETFDYANTLCVYFPKFVMQYLRDKFIAKSVALADKSFAKKVFISRVDAPFSRRVLNEDEIFSIVEKHGFVRYVMSDLSFVEQVALFNQAEIIISANGSGLTNSMFCSENAQIVEIFQARPDSTFCNIAQTLGLRYMPIQTCYFNTGLAHDSTCIPLWTIEQLISMLKL